MKLNKNSIMLRKRRTDAVNNFLEELGSKDKYILDIGCEYGSSLSRIAKNNKCFGIDSNENALRMARQRGIKTFHRDLNQGLSFKNNFFDIVIITSVLEHLLDPIKMIEDIKRVMKKDGMLIISLPNDFEIIRRFKFLIFGRDQEIDDELNPHTHLHLLSVSRWEEFLSRHFFIREIYNDSRISRSLAKILPNIFSIEKIWVCRVK
jgi:SAM-dependent methyltransferase